MADTSPSDTSTSSEAVSDDFPRMALPVVPVFVAALLLVGLGSFGIWDPAELTAADAARRWSEGEPFDWGQPPLGSWLIGLGFMTFGPTEWAGRIPLALCGLATLAVGGHWVRTFAGVRAGMYTMLIAGTAPLLLFQSRQMLGDSPTLLAAAMVMLGASQVVYGPDRFRPAWAALTVVATVMGVAAGGALLGVLPPLGAVALCGLLLPPAQGQARAAWLGCGALFGVLVLLVVHDIWADTAAFSIWVGGKPLGDAPRTYDRGLELIFHAFLPWSGLLPVAFGQVLTAPPPGEQEQPETALRLQIVAWAALAYGAQALFASRYGHAAFGAPLALGAAVAVLLCDLEQRPRANWWPSALVCLLFTGLLLRDIALYPASPVDGLGVGELEVPDSFNPKRTWALLLGAVCAALSFVALAGPEERKFDPRAPYRLIAELWRRGWGYRLWLLGVGALLLGLAVFSIVSWTGPRSLGLSSIAAKVGRALLAVWLLPVVVVGGQWAWSQAPRLNRFRTLPLLVLGAAAGVYAGHRYMPSLSEHFSPRQVYEVFNELAKEDELLGQHKVAGRSASYYARGEVEEFKKRTELVKWLADRSGPRRWAVFPGEQLAEVDVGFRRKTKHHLFVPTNTNGRITLASNQPLEGAYDFNPLSKTVVAEAPELAHKVGAVFDNKVELLGYNLELPGGDHVGPGESFAVTWAFRAMRGSIGNYEVFLHVDGPGKRIHGDHVPVDGKYPVRVWARNDIVLDKQVIQVPASTRTGTYTLYLGFFRGNSRLKVVEGEKDNANRVRTGTIRIR